MIGHKINDTREALKFMFAGKSIFTFINTKTGNRFTYKIKSNKESNLFFVSVLTNPDNYSYIGTCIEGNYRHGKKTTYQISSKYGTKDFVANAAED